MEWPPAFDPLPGPGAALQQTIDWPRDAWVRLVRHSADRHDPDVDDSSLVDALDELAEQPLDRARLCELADDGRWRLLWLGTLVWGYGGRQLNRGPSSAAKGWSRPSLTDAVEATALAAREGAAAAFDAREVLPYGMQVPMGSKLWHFAGRGHAELEPLIYDRNVSLALNQGVDGDWPAPNALERDGYVRWCEWATQFATAGREPADVELAVFTTGRRLRTEGG